MQVSFSDPVAPSPIPTNEDFYRAWRPKVIAMARTLGLVDPEAIAQDVVVDFVTSGYMLQWDQAKGKSFDSFAYWMLRNRLFSRLRTQRRQRSHYITTDVDPDEGFEEDGFEHAEQRVDLSALAETISGRPGEILRTLIHFTETGEAMRDADVARVLGCSATNVQQHRVKLRAMLRDVLV